MLQNYLLSRLGEGKINVVVYLVPTRALIAQVAQDLSSHFVELKTRAPKVVTIPIGESGSLPNQGVYVLTQERTQILLQSHQDFVPDLIVVDEAQSIQDGARGILLHWVIDDLLARNPNAQIVFASPTVANLGVFAALFGLSDVVNLSTDEGTVAQNFILVDVESARGGLLSVSTAERESREPISIGRRHLAQRSRAG